MPATGDLACALWFQQHSISNFFGTSCMFRWNTQRRGNGLYWLELDRELNCSGMCKVKYLFRYKCNWNVYLILETKTSLIVHVGYQIVVSYFEDIFRHMDKICLKMISFCKDFPFLQACSIHQGAIYVCAVINQISKYIMQSITNTTCSSQIWLLP